MISNFYYGRKMVIDELRFSGSVVCRAGVKSSIFIFCEEPEPTETGRKRLGGISVASPTGFFCVNLAVVLGRPSQI